MPPRTKIFLTLIPLLALSCLLSMLLTYLLNRPYHRVIWQSCHPATLHYNDFDPYCLSVVERGAGHPEYGHILFFPKDMFVGGR